MNIPLQTTRNNPYFAGLDTAQLEETGRRLFEKEADRGQIIFFEGEPSEALYFVLEGVVKIYKTSADGKEQILQLIKPGESFNDVPVLSGGSNLVSAEALSRARLYGIKKTDLEELMMKNPRVAMNVVGILSERVRQLLLLVEDLSFKHVMERVARILLDTAGDSASHPRLTQQEMAAMAGTAREMVGRSLKALEEEGLIRMEHHRIIVKDEKALKARAGTAD